MARVTNPLFSLSASGTVGKLVSYRIRDGRFEVLKKPHPKTTPSANQVIERQRMIDARNAFLSLSTTDLAHWQAVATVTGVNSWMAFFREWQIQQVEAGQFPLIPDPTLIGG